MKAFFIKLKFIIDVNDKNTLLKLFFLTIIVSVIETVAVASIMPFVSVSTDLSVIESNNYYRYVYDFLGFDNKINFIVSFGCLLIVFYMFRSFLNIYYTYVSANFFQSKYYKTSSKLFDKYMKMKYKDYILQNTSQLTKSIITETMMVSSMLKASFMILSEVLVFLFIIIIFIMVDYKITIFLLSFLLLLSFIMLKTISKVIKEKGKERSFYQQKFYEILNKSFNNYKILKIDIDKDKIIREFYSASKKFAKSNVINSTLSNVPRLVIEGIAFCVVILMVLYILVFGDQSDRANSMAIISVFVLGLYRLMPSANRILSSYNIVVFNLEALNIIVENLKIESEKLDIHKINFDKEINLNDVQFSYDNNNIILDKINLNIKKSEKIAFVGDSGSGKSTLVDIIMGLLRPSSGKIFVDDNIISDCNLSLWRDKVGYIPQEVYLFDGTVAENVALNHELHEQKVKDVLKQAKILEFLSSLKNGIHTSVGEGGVMLSGGQKQRIAIARALYKDPEILILDEATSALDHNVEEEIMNEIYKIANNKTLIIIAHRLSTVLRCDKIYKVEQKNIKEIAHEEVK